MSRHLSPLQKCSLQVKISSEIFSSSMSQKRRLKPKSLKLSEVVWRLWYLNMMGPNKSEIGEVFETETISINQTQEERKKKRLANWICWWNGKSLKRMVRAIFMYCISAFLVSILWMYERFTKHFSGNHQLGKHPIPPKTHPREQAALSQRTLFRCISRQDSCWNHLATDGLV